ncbi:transcription factor IIIB 90 kDa subunit-like [Triticum urartu]|uniref:transcription factor IIIB 90 kDa subunit-like n=1 Tax=Triticum urartu TaxID=4572 RepID=UPI002044590E|nr:transcription factor IIIB 90 kDa subunit-like [Triticum urartu]
MVFCAHCQDDCPYIQDPDNGITCCGMCGKVFDEHIFEVGPTFVKNSSGQSEIAGKIIEGVGSGCSISRERTEAKGISSLHFLYLISLCTLRIYDAAVVHVCEATLFKRLVEFENTDSGSLTIEDFLAKADEETVPNCPAKYGEVLCEHKGAEYFSHGLCEECHYNFTELSGGLEGGADPPAFQRAEKKRHDAAKRAKDSSVLDATLCELHSSDVEHNIMSPGKNCVGKSSTGSSSQTANDFEAPINPEVEGENGKADSDPGNLSDIDDVEVDGYLHNEEETQNKKIIWEEMNKEYLEEQAAKEALAAELAARGISVGEGRPKKRKRKEDKNSTPAETPAEATCNMLKRKGLGSKINVEAISGLYNTEDEVSKANGKDDLHFDEEYEHNVGYGETFDASYDYGHDADYNYEGYIDEGGGGGYDDCHDADY